jgi:hypothetical protein
MLILTRNSATARCVISLLEVVSSCAVGPAQKSRAGRDATSARRPSGMWVAAPVRDGHALGKTLGMKPGLLGVSACRGTECACNQANVPVGTLNEGPACRGAAALRLQPFSLVLSFGRAKESTKEGKQLKQ